MILLLLCLFIGIGVAMAQTKKISGTVIADEDGQPVIGASIMVKGTTIGVTSDVDGKFVLNVPASAKNFKVSFLGMQTKEVEIKQGLTIKLVSSAKNLDEVVVVGYGSARKVGSVIGTVSKVNSDKIEGKPAANVMDALQGKVAGLLILSGSGEPNSLSSAYLRGVGSLETDNDPLYIIDGTPVDAAIMRSINPSDIESVTVLKDASATSIYGSRASNGVIYITSKKGKMGAKPIVSVTGSYGVSSLARRIGNPMNSAELLEFQLKNGFIKQEVYDKNKATGYDTKWQDYFFKDNAPTKQAAISIQGGTDRTTYFLSSSYFYQEGTVPRSDYERFTVRTNVDTRVNDWLKIGMNTMATYDITQKSAYTYGGSNSLNGGIFGTILNPSYYNPYDADGNILDVIPGLNRYSPNFLSNKQPNKNNTARVTSSAYIQLMPFKGLVLKSQANVNAYDYRSTAKTMPSFPAAKGLGKVRERFARSTELTLTNTAEYKFKISDNHSATLLAGQEGIKGVYEEFIAETNGQNDDRLLTIGTGPKATFLGSDAGYRSDFVFSSLFARADYNFSEKYFADFSVRRDGSSRFGKDNKYATFLSGGLMWNVKAEKFLEDVKAITALKLKTSIGTMGNSSISNYTHLSAVSTSTYNGATGWYVSNPGNNNLKWEKQQLFNIGFDLSLLNRYTVEVSYYSKSTSNMLMDVPVPYSTGFSTVKKNAGSMVNKGIELSLSADLIKTKDFSFNFSGNVSYNKNKITELFYNLDEWPMSSTLTMYKVGAPMQYFLPMYAGVDSKDGAPMWYLPGTNNTKTTKEYNQSELSQASGKERFAPYTGGFSFTASWKGLTLATDFSYVLGKYMINNDRYFSENPTAFPTMNQSKDLLGNIWEKEGDICMYPAIGYRMEFDDHLLENASFLRMKNISLSYQFPKSVLGYTKVLRSLKIYANARNLFTITKYKGADPELDTNLTYGAYPASKEFTVGLEVTF